MTNQKLIMIEKDKNIAYKRNIAKYLQELNRFCKKKPVENELLSLDETQNIRDNSKALDTAIVRRHRIGFDKKNDEKFLDFVGSLYEKNRSNIYIWTPLTMACGTYKIDSILDFNFGFEFDSNPEGIVVLLTSNFTDKITLDFSMDESGKRILDIDLVGDNWGK
ncbi:hypothetical protein ACH518_04160 [Methylomonas sp. HW2-6]|uniref:hypothetical protein n=1 Tax=Methylomonas sp. HW2-6 TaxID=3376687 RepID=UPI00404265CD